MVLCRSYAEDLLGELTFTIWINLLMISGGSGLTNFANNLDARLTSMKSEMKLSKKGNSIGKLQRLDQRLSYITIPKLSVNHDKTIPLSFAFFRILMNSTCLLSN